MPATGAIFVSPATIYAGTCAPCPTKSAAATGTRINAASGDRRFVRINASSAATARAPVIASIAPLPPT